MPNPTVYAAESPPRCTAQASRYDPMANNPTTATLGHTRVNPAAIVMNTPPSANTTDAASTDPHTWWRVACAPADTPV